jgi:hypothetical protein
VAIFSVPTVICLLNGVCVVSHMRVVEEEVEVEHTNSVARFEVICSYRPFHNL